jgi:hypothetical protein
MGKALLVLATAFGLALLCTITLVLMIGDVGQSTLGGEIPALANSPLRNVTFKVAGPVASFLIILCFLSSYLLIIENRTISVKAKNVRRILGDWHFSATSGSGAHVSGKCTISRIKDGLHIQGTYDGVNLPNSGAWRAKDVMVRDDTLTYVFRSNPVARRPGNNQNDVDDPHLATPDTTLGVTTLDVPPKGKVREMHGIWGVLGDSNRGFIHFTRRPADPQ